MNHSIRLAIVVLGLLGTVSCTWRDPYRRDDVWKPTGANAANLAATIAEPRDLTHGRGSSGADAKVGVLSMERVQSDRPKSLGDPTSSGLSGAGGAAGGGAPTAPPGN